MQASVHNNRREGFTLIELLAVIFIMALVLGVVVGVGQLVAKGAGVQGAAQTIHRKLMLARQQAITKKTPVAFLIMDPAFFNPDYPTLDGYTQIGGRAYAIWDIKNEAYLQSWKELPQGAVFDNVTVIPAGLNGINIAERSTNTDNERGDGEEILKDVPFPSERNAQGSATERLRNFYCIIFQPSGRMIREENGIMYRWIVIREGGVVQESTTSFRVTPAHAGSIKYGIQVSHAGRFKIVDLTNS